jgi:hypothetical protein
LWKRTVALGIELDRFEPLEALDVLEALVEVDVLLAKTVTLQY